MGTRILLLAAGAVLGVVLWTGFLPTEGGGGEVSYVDAPREAKPPAPTDDAPGLTPGGREPPPRLLRAEARPAPDPEAEARRLRVAALWERALALHAMGRHAQALALLRQALETDEAFFEEPGRKTLLAAMRKGSVAVTEAEATGDRLRRLVEELRRWGNLRPLDDAEEAAALERQLRHAAVQLAALEDKKERAILLRHLERFLLPGARRAGDLERARARGKLDVDGLLRSVHGREMGREEPTLPLPLDDPEAIERRRMEQLELLRQRGALSLLDALHAGLAWLAIHQAEDGRFSEAGTLERAIALQAEDPEALELVKRSLKRARETYALSTTALALMAFLDFRDQDAGGLFEPTIARALAWLRKQQDDTGLFGRRGRSYYSQAIALMALAQAAGATGDDELRKRVATGLATLYELRGPLGGYRYKAEQPGDLSVTGWVVQAVEYAQHSGIELPRDMREELTRFLKSVWIGDERFSYVVPRPGDRWGRASLWPVGMLCGRILWEEVPEKTLASWRRWSKEIDKRRAPALYTLYYGVRMDVWLNGKLTTRWHTWLHELAARQVKAGPLAGAYPSEVGAWTRHGGSTLTTALALLTAEHALFLR